MSGTEVILRTRRTKYHWPALQLNFWLLIMIIGSSTILGIFSYFISVQAQLRQGTPWLVQHFLLLLAGYGREWIWWFPPNPRAGLLRSYDFCESVPYK